jgi:hypothetical protein
MKTKPDNLAIDLLGFQVWGTSRGCENLARQVGRSHAVFDMVGTKKTVIAFSVV